jgi:hypothetical protein
MMHVYRSWRVGSFLDTGSAQISKKQKQKKNKQTKTKKTVEIPTPKPYIFLFLVSRSIWLYVSHDHTWWSRPPIGSAQIFWKPLRYPPINHIYSCSLCLGTFNGMLIMTIRNSPIPIKPEVLQYHGNRWDPHPQTSYIFVPCVTEHLMVHVCSYDHTGWSHGRPSLNRKCLIIATTVESSTPELQVQACRVPRQWPPLHVTWNCL